MFGKYVDRDGYEARILALALIGKVGDPETAFNSVQPEMVEKGYQLDNAEMAAHLGIPVVLAEVVDALHRIGHLPAVGIVNVLRLGSVGID